MPTCFDIAKYITNKTGPITAMKLQKLVYYSQAWSLVWDEEALFDEDFEAWANGPVIQDLYKLHRGMFKVDCSLFRDANEKSLSQDNIETIDIVIDYYGAQTAQWLSNLTHQESPWIDARGDHSAGDLCNTIIQKSAMHEYYSSL